MRSVPKPILKNRVPEHVERAVIDLAIENPDLGQLRASQELLQKRYYCFEYRGAAPFGYAMT